MSSKSRFPGPKHPKFRPTPMVTNPDTNGPPVSFAVFKALTVGPFYTGVRMLWFIPAFTIGFILSPLFYIGMELRVSMGNRAIKKRLAAAKATAPATPTTEPSK